MGLFITTTTSSIYGAAAVRPYSCSQGLDIRSMDMADLFFAPALVFLLQSEEISCNHLAGP